MTESAFNEKIIEICGNNSKAQYEFLKKFDKPILGGGGWKVFRPQHTKPESGVYLTIRCGLDGIYQTWNVWDSVKKKWLAESADGSTTIMYKDIESEL